MNLKALSHVQLYLLSVNKAHNSLIRKLAKEELNSRTFNEESCNTINEQKQLLLHQKSLTAVQKIIIVIFGAALSSSLLFIIHNVIASFILDKGYMKMHKEYWFFVSCSYLFWTLMLLFITSITRL
jgi:hypothetical protein